MVYSTRRFVLSLALYYFVLVLVFFSPFSIVISSLGEERANFCALRTFVRFALVRFCLFPLLLGVWKGLQLVIVALFGLFSYLFFVNSYTMTWSSAYYFEVTVHQILAGLCSFENFCDFFLMRLTPPTVYIRLS